MKRLVLAAALTAASAASNATVVANVFTGTDAEVLAFSAQYQSYFTSGATIETFENGFTTVAGGADNSGKSVNTSVGTFTSKNPGTLGTYGQTLALSETDTTIFSGRKNSTTGGSNWLDSNDSTRVVWDLELDPVGAFSNVGFLMSDVGDVEAFLDIKFKDGTTEVVNLLGDTADGNMQYITAHFDPSVTYNGFFALPSLETADGSSLIGSMDIMGALTPAILPVVIALVMTAVFDATGTIRALAGQANLLDKDGKIIDGGKALTADSASSMVAGLVGGAPAAVYIESAAGTAAGGKTGLTATVVGVLFLVMIFLSPVSYLVPTYATAPALMYVGLLMLSNVSKLDFEDSVDALSGLVCAVFIILSANIVTGIMIGFTTLVVGRVFAGEFKKLNVGIVSITIALIVFYVGGWAI